MLSVAFSIVAVICGVDVVSAFLGVSTAKVRHIATSKPIGDGDQSQFRAPASLSVGNGDCHTNLEQNALTARVLADALPFIQAYADKTVVIKYGGHAMENAEASLSFARDVVMLKQCGVNPVVVHGGGPQIAAMLKRLDIPTSFVEGVRVSDPDTVDVAEMVLCGKINKEIASNIKRAGARALGVSGRDDNLLMAKKLGKQATDEATGEVKQLDIGFVGNITSVNARVSRVDIRGSLGRVDITNYALDDGSVIRDLVGSGIVPVIAPIGVDGSGRTYNCNADTAAGAIASALNAYRLLLLTDVAGVLDKDKNLLQELDSVQVGKLVKDGTISGGMIPKVNTALDAIRGGVGASIILDGRVRNALLLELFTPGGAGTLIRLPNS